MTDEPVSDQVAASPPAPPRKKSVPRLSYQGSPGKFFKLAPLPFAAASLSGGFFLIFRIWPSRAAILSTIRVRGEPVRTGPCSVPERTALLKNILLLSVLLGLCLGLLYSGHVLVALLTLTGLAMAGHACRYQSRQAALPALTWNGQALALEGRFPEYLKLSCKRTLLSVVTLGYGIARSDLERWDFFANHLRLGGHAFAWQGDHRRLAWVNMLSLWLPLLMLTVLIAMASSIAPANANVAVVAHENVKMTFIQILSGLVLVAGILGRAWYHAALRAAQLNGLTCGPVRFRSIATGKDYFRLRLVNLLLMGLSLGLAYSVVLDRNLRFGCRTLQIAGDLDFLSKAKGS